MAAHGREPVAQTLTPVSGVVHDHVMAAPDLAHLLDDALRPRTEHAWQEEMMAPVERVHTVLVDAIERVLPAGETQALTFFNHTFIPDLIYRDGDFKRDIYFRFDAGIDDIFAQYSIAYAGSDGPIFICFSPTPAPAQPDWDPAAVPHADVSLVLPVASLQELCANPTENAELVLRHGAGYLSPADAARAAAGDPQTLRACCGSAADDLQLRLV